MNSGYKQSLFWGGESRYGSAGAIDEALGLVQSINPTESNSLIKIRTLGGTRDYSNIVPGKFEITGSFEYYLQDGPFFRQALGEDTGTTATVDTGPRVHTGWGEAASAYCHVMGSAESPTTDDFPSFTLEFTDAEDTGAAATTKNLKRLYDGCRVNSMTISGSVDEPVKVAVDFQAQGVTVSTGAATSVTEPTTDPFVFYQGVVYCTAGAVVEDTSIAAMSTSARICEVNSFDVSVNNNLEAIWYVSGTCTPSGQTKRGLKNLIVKGRDYEANLGLHFKNRSMYQKFLGATSATTDQDTLAKYTIVLDFVRSGTIGAVKTVTDNYLRIVLGSCAFNTINIPGNPEDVISQNLNVFVEKAKFYVVDDDLSYA